MARSFPDLKRRLPGRGVWVTATRTAIDEAVKRNVFARSLKREVERGRPTLAPSLSASSRTLRSMRSAIAHKAGRVAIGFGRTETRAGRRSRRWRRSSAPPTAPPMGRARSRRPRPGVKTDENAGRNPGHCGVYVGAIGFGIGAVKCGTCCPARRPSEQRVPCALPEPRTLPDCRSGRTRCGIARGRALKCNDSAGSGLDVNGY